MEAERIVAWMQNVVADASTSVEPLKRIDEAYNRSLTEEIYGNPVYRVVKFFNLADQGFHQLFGVISPVCTVTEGDLMNEQSF